jgi:hypothetical protein
MSINKVLYIKHRCTEQEGRGERKVRFEKVGHKDTIKHENKGPAPS